MIVLLYTNDIAKFVEKCQIMFLGAAAFTGLWKMETIRSVYMLKQPASRANRFRNIHNLFILLLTMLSKRGNEYR